MKRQLLFLSFILFASLAIAQHSPIPSSNYTVLGVSSDNGDHPAEHAFDGDLLTWWALYNSDGFELPGYVDIDLGEEYNVGGFEYTPNANNTSRKAASYLVYLSTDGENWTEDAGGSMGYLDESDSAVKTITFGAVTTRYIRISYPTSWADDGNIHTQELVVLADSTLATGQTNQVITVDAIAPKFATDADFDINATVNTGLDLTYEVVEGPATVDGNTVSLTGDGGVVTINVIQAGNDDYYAAQTPVSFVVYSLDDYQPEITTRLTSAYPIEMPSLDAYPIYINTAIAHDSLLSIDNVEVEIGGQVLTAADAGGFYYVLWTPSEYGNHSVVIKAEASNGQQASITREVEVVNTAVTQEVTSLQDVVIWFGEENSRWYYGEGYTLPQSVGAYDQIIAHFEVECPEGNCDDWDRRSFIDIKAPNGEWIQVLRYITPYNVGCTHSIDVTDYMSLLQGELEFRAFVDTWGTGGWQYTLTFEYVAGTPDYKYSSVASVWDELYPLGDPANLQPVTTVAYTFPEGTEQATMRLSTTGHGWGENNHLNAAEFYHAYNYIDVNDETAFTQNLWNDCNPNPDNCTDQQGTWYFDRAGWCPGIIAPPHIFNLEEYISQGNIDLGYRFAPAYIDYCHPNYAGCYSGITCPNCDDGYAAVYDVDAHVIAWSNTPLVYNPDLYTGADDVTALSYNINTYPNPTQETFQISCDDFEGSCFVFITGIDGKQINGYNFATAQDMRNFVFSLEKVNTGTYFITVQNSKGMGVHKITKS